ncbi:hypothetical protein [Litoreibacter roseus]|uniref:Uncharacterized protein n=1 Tax=Litoreibacter roseus TaxID=2601869 RepID=A0A6N6JB42_9RHOB|nr:hypothetical protein [Litoreibacter roseus]GFE63274.1 hypothetical protein KIN_03480 [Litoreibacter roseus]
MSDTQINPRSLPHLLKDAATATWGLARTPLFSISTSRGLARSLNAGRPIHLGDRGQSHRIVFETVDTTPDLTQQVQITARVAEMVRAEDWIGLAKQLADWDQARAATPAGIRLTEIALRAAGYAAAGRALPTPYTEPVAPAVPHHIADLLDAMAMKQPQLYGLTALAAAFRIYQGWSIRGKRAAEDVPHADWTRMAEAFNRAEWVLAPLDPILLNAPLLAALRFETLICHDDPRRYLHRYYEDWVELDPGDQRAHSKMAWLLSPLWYGSFDELDALARRAVEATQTTTGTAAYASIYRKTMTCAGEMIFRLDTALLESAVFDLIDHRGSDPAFVARLLKELRGMERPTLPRGLSKLQKDIVKKKAQRVRQIRTRIIRERLSAIHPASWPGGTAAALTAISDAMQPELRRGCQLQMSSDGITVQKAAA